MDLGTTAARAVIGSLFVGHGAQKLFGSFGGHGPEGTGGFFESLGIKPGKPNAILAGASELGGGALLALGALTPVAASMISGTMLTAIRTAHKGKGPWVTEGGWEYNAVIVTGLFAIAYRGPGSPSVDERYFPNMKGTAWALGQLAAAAAGSYLVTAQGQSDPEPEQVATAGDPATQDARFSRTADAAATQQP